MSETLADLSLRYDLVIASCPVAVEWLAHRQGPFFENVRREALAV